VIVSAASLALIPIDFDLKWGQINILLMLLVLADRLVGHVWLVTSGWSPSG
jgi:hypothetical protein